MREPSIHLLVALLAMGFGGRAHVRGEDTPGNPSVDLNKAPAALKEWGF